jgi:hypothetical protein
MRILRSFFLIPDFKIPMDERQGLNLTMFEDETNFDKGRRM